MCCHCGCKAWCSYVLEVLQLLHYCFQALATQQWPLQRHDGRYWQPQDRVRSSKAGQKLSIAGALIQIRGDWAEFCERLGFPTWQSARRPCLSCAADRGNWYDVARCSPLELPWHLNSHDDLDRACQRCEVWVALDAAGIREVRASLRYDKRKAGNLGRSLKKDLLHLGLRQGDRLEPNSSLRDVACFERCELAPGGTQPFLFWRRSMESVCTRRCPLWDPALGITAGRVICYDMLHTMHLGVMHSFVHFSLWRILLSGAFPAREATAAENRQTKVMLLRNEIFSWYKTVKGRL